MRRHRAWDAAAAAALTAAAAAAFAADEFQQVLATTAKTFRDTRATMMKPLKAGKWFPDEAAADVDAALAEAAAVFRGVCDGKKRISFPDASHWVDVAGLRDRRWRFGDDTVSALTAPAGAAVRFRAEWTREPAAEAWAVAVAVAEYPQAVYDAAGRHVQSAAFQGAEAPVSHHDLAKLLDAAAAAWAKDVPGAVTVPAAKKSVGVARWFATASAPATDERAAVRRDWYAWETPGTSWRVDGTTWVATVAYAASAVADPKGRAPAEALLKEIHPVFQ